MNLLLILAFIALPVFVVYKLLTRGSKADENSAAYMCTRCERMYFAPDFPFNSKCGSCGGNVQPYHYSR